MHVLVAFDKFKNSMSAAEACSVAGDALRELHPDWKIESAPLTDGGEGFAKILAEACSGHLEIVPVRGARFQPVDAKLGWVQLKALPSAARERLQVADQGTLAIVEMAQASGLQALASEDRDLWRTTSFGTGQLIRHAADAGADAILVGLGGSATNDLGVGALEALGMTSYDQRLQPVAELTPAKWKHVTSLGGIVNVRQKLPPIRIACDVDNPLLGESGATAVFGPQKGLRPEDHDRLERLMRKMADRLLGLFGHPPEAFEARRNEPGSGAAGGLGFGLRTALPDASYVPGFPLVAEWLQLNAKIACADIVLTGEGGFDRGSLGGKGPSAILGRLSGDQGCYLLAGRVTDEARSALADHPHLRALEAIAPTDQPLAECLAQGPELLRRSVRKLFSGNIRP